MIPTPSTCPAAVMKRLHRESRKIVDSEGVVVRRNVNFGTTIGPAQPMDPGDYVKNARNGGINHAAVD